MSDYNPFSLKGKKILVTGASSGIGRATAIECSRMGAQIIICGRNEQRLADTMAALSGNGHKSVAGDLATETGISELVSQAENLDGVVFCAGAGLTCPVLFNSRKKFDSVFDVNFFAPVELMRLLIKKKKIADGASLVFIASIGGINKFSPGNSAYGASKAALSSIVKFASVELKSKRIRVNTINPGMIETPLINRGTLTTEQFTADAAHYMLNRYGKPEEVAYAAVYLLSDASIWVTGSSMILDGGVSVK